MSYFLKEDLAELEARIHTTIESLKETGVELRTAVTQSSETWHDNFGFENAQQQARLLGQRLKELEQIHRNAVIVKKPSTNEFVSIGHTVTVKDCSTNELKTFIIGSQITFTQNAISYASPIGKLLIEKKVGQRTTGVIGDKERTYEIMTIA